jgi:hypothetical protein
MDSALPPVAVTLQKAVKLQQATLQLPAPGQAIATVATSAHLPETFDLRDTDGVVQAHAAVGIDITREAALLFSAKYLGEVTPVQISDCTTLLGCLSLYPCKRIVTLAPNPPLADSLMKRYGIALSSHTWPAHLSPPQFEPSWFSTISKKHSSEWIFTSAAPGTECLALATAAQFASNGVLMLVPYGNLAQAPPELQRLLHTYKCADRLAVIQRSPSVNRMWLSVFSSIATRSAAVAAGGPSSHDCWVSM